MIQADLSRNPDRRKTGTREETAAAEEGYDRRIIKKRKKDEAQGAIRKPEAGKEKTDPVAALLTVLSVLIYAAGFLMGLSKGYGSIGIGEEGFENFRWFAAVLYWLATFAAGTLILDLPDHPFTFFDRSEASNISLIT